MSTPRALATSLIASLFAALVVIAPAPARADEDDSAHPAEPEHPAPTAAPEAAHPDHVPEAAGAEAPAEHAEAPAEHAEAPAEHAEAPAGQPEASATEEDAAEPPYVEYDADGDGKVEPDELALQQEFSAAFKDMPTEITDAELDRRPAGSQLTPSLTAEQFRAMVKVARAKVLERLQAKMQRKSDATMAKISYTILYFSLAGLLLLLGPLVLRRRYPGQTASLLKYSALAALTFVVTVNLFGTVVLGFRTAQGALGAATNPQLRIASGFFDSLDHNAEELLITGKELFAPTLAQLQGNGDEQPTVVLLENGQRVIKDAKVFVSVAKMFKKLDVVFSLLPTVLLLVTMILFVLAIKPTLVEIVRLPIAAAGGRVGAGRQVVTGALRRIGGELIATLCTLGVLVVLTLLAGSILGRVVRPALDALISYFSLGVSYLQFVEGASSSLVFLMLFSVILFLALNLAAVVVSMSLFLGKAQKIFQRRFNDGVPIASHVRFWKWGIPAVLVAQLVPWLYLALARWGLDAINDKLTSGVTDAAQIPWKSIMLIGPLCLIGGFVVMFWAARGVKSLGFLATYKVPAPGVTPGAPAGAVTS